MILGLLEAEGEVEVDLEREEGWGLAGDLAICLANMLSREPFFEATGYEYAETGQHLSLGKRGDLWAGSAPG